MLDCGVTDPNKCPNRRQEATCSDAPTHPARSRRAKPNLRSLGNAQKCRILLQGLRLTEVIGNGQVSSNRAGRRVRSR